MAMNSISDISLEKEKEEFSVDDMITVDVKFSIQGGLREAFNEKIGQKPTTIMIIYSS